MHVVWDVSSVDAIKKVIETGVKAPVFLVPGHHCAEEELMAVRNLNSDIIALNMSVCAHLLLRSKARGIKAHQGCCSP